MKKLLALLLAAVMVVSLAACAGTPEETTPSTDPATEPATEPVEDTTEPSTEATTRENKLIFGTTTDITGDWTGGIVTNGATDMMISSMINDYATLVTNQDGNYVENPTVLKGWERTDNEDGSATYTISINEGLTYNNGEPITIKDYVFKILLQCSSAAAGLNFTSATHTAVVGGTDYRDDAVDVLSGLKIVDDYTMSLSIVPDYAQYYYADTYAAVGPGTSPTGSARATMWPTTVRARTSPRTARRLPWLWKISRTTSTPPRLPLPMWFPPVPTT